MDNQEKLKKSFSEALGIDESRVGDSLEYNSIAEWDSIAHMKLVASLEAAFDIMFDTEDIIDMSSYKKAREIISKYGPEFR